MNYAAISATGTSPIGLVVRLYEAVIGDLGRAVIAIRDDDVQKRSFELQHALVIIGQLQGSLDMANGGDPAKMLDRFYGLAHARIIEAQFRQSGKLLEELIRDFLLLRDTWVEVENAERPSTPPPGGSGGSGEWVA